MLVDGVPGVTGDRLALRGQRGMLFPERPISLRVHAW